MPVKKYRAAKNEAGDAVKMIVGLCFRGVWLFRIFKKILPRSGAVFSNRKMIPKCR